MARRGRSRGKRSKPIRIRTENGPHALMGTVFRREGIYFAKGAQLMKNRALKGALALLTVLALTMSAAAAEGYMMVFGSLDVYADRDMTFGPPSRYVSSTLSGKLSAISVAVYTSGNTCRMTALSLMA